MSGFRPKESGVPADNYSGGLFNYSDLETTGTPIEITGGAGPTVLTNDGEGSLTNKSYIPSGVTDIWDATAMAFDWSDLKPGDMVDIRIDVDVTTASPNTAVGINLYLGDGLGSYSIPWVLETNFKNAETHKLNTFNGIYLVDSNTLDNGGVFKLAADKDCDVVVNGWYCKVIKGG